MIFLVEQPIDIANYVEMNNLIVNLKGESNGETAVTALWWHHVHWRGWQRVRSSIFSRMRTRRCWAATHRKHLPTSC